MRGLTLVLLVGLTRPTAADVDSTRLSATASPKLFSIERSLNRNQVVYEAVSDAKGFSPTEPIRIYWVMAEKGGSTEPLTSFERRYAYGINVKKVSANEAVFALKALPDRDLIARRLVREGRLTFQAETKISGRNCILEKVFIQSEGSGLIPKVKFTEISGQAVDDGTPLSEKIEKP